MTESLYRASKASVTAGLIVVNGQVISYAPIFGRVVGYNRDLEYVLYLLKQGGFSIQRYVDDEWIEV